VLLATSPAASCAARKRYPLVLMLEPLFQCNLACAGCGKIDHPKEILQKRMSVADAVRAVDECGAPVVSIPGGEPLIHREMPQIVAAIVARKNSCICAPTPFCSPAYDEYRPSRYLTFSIHLDGNQNVTMSQCARRGVRQGSRGSRLARSRASSDRQLHALSGADPDEVAEFFDTAMELGIEGITVSPGYSYQHAPRRTFSWGAARAAAVPRNLQTPSRRASRWSFNHSGLFLDFLAGNQTYQCTPWSNPTITSSVGSGPAICFR